MHFQGRTQQNLISLGFNFLNHRNIYVFISSIQNGTQSLRCFVTKDVENLEKEVERWVENFVFPGELCHRAVDPVPNSIFPSSKLLPESAWMGNLIENDWAYLKFDASDNNKSWSSFFSLTKERAGILLNRHAIKSKRGFGLEFVVWVCYLKWFIKQIKNFAQLGKIYIVILLHSFK
jgi:hypothetical protein